MPTCTQSLKINYYLWGKGDKIKQQMLNLEKERDDIQAQIDQLLKSIN